MRNEAYQLDPFFQDIPWDIIYDDDGRQIGEVYVLLGAARKEGMPRHEDYGSGPWYKLRRLGNDGARETTRFRTSRLYRNRNA